MNAAGILTANAPVDELDAEDFRRNFEVNLLGVFQASQAFGPLLRAAPGAVVNVASQAALVSLPQQAAYTAAKGAVAALTRSLAIDWAEHGVRVNAVAPGFTRTPMTEAFFENATFTAAATRRIPLGRLLEAREVASAIVFLASPLALGRDRRRPSRGRWLDRRRAGAALVRRAWATSSTRTFSGASTRPIPRRQRQRARDRDRERAAARRRDRRVEQDRRRLALHAQAACEPVR